jgi:hypothetical protein
MCKPIVLADRRMVSVGVLCKSHSESMFERKMATGLARPLPRRSFDGIPIRVSKDASISARPSSTAATGAKASDGTPFSS